MRQRGNPPTGTRGHQRNRAQRRAELPLPADARPYAHPDGPNPDLGVHALADLEDGLIPQFIRAWYATLVTRRWFSATDTERKLADLLEARDRPDRRSLAGNPPLLTLMASSTHYGRDVESCRSSSRPP